jgi:hypothetical protein
MKVRDRNCEIIETDLYILPKRTDTTEIVGDYINCILLCRQKIEDKRLRYYFLHYILREVNCFIVNYKI